MTDELTTVHVRRAREGDTASWEWLAARLSPLLRSQVTYRLGEKLRRLYDADDVVNDAWVTVIPKLSKLRARDGRWTPVLLKYLSTVILHRINDLTKKHITGKPPVVQLGGGFASSDAPLEVPEADISGIVTRAIRMERSEQLHQTLKELGEEDREILVLRGIEQIPNSDIASQLGIGASAVSMRYRRALERLRAELPGSIFAELPDG